MPTSWRLSLGLALFALALPVAAQTAAQENMTVNARFLLAARNADTAGMKRGLADGAAVNSRNRLGESALIVVLKKNRVDLAQLVIDAGADINQPALNGITALMAAAYEGQTEMARQLLAKGANPAAFDRLQKNAMIYAAGEGRTGVVTLLLANGIDPNAVYHNNLTALMWAAGFGKTDTVRALLAAGANPQLKDNRGKTAADMAREQNFAETAQLLDSARIFHAQAHGAGLKTIAILDFDLVDDQHELSPATVEYQRLRAIRDQLQEEFAKSHLYRVVDLGPASELIKKYQSETQLHACNGCELEIARSLHADRVLIGWVQKVSNLILNINIQIEDAVTGAVLLNKSVDLRGNTDETWRRGVSYLVRSMVEKDQGNR